MNPGLSLGLVSYNGWDKLQAALTSIGAQELTRPLEVVLCDNGSAEPIRQRVAAAWPEVRVLPNERNLGFAAGTNLALASARLPLLMMLNPDTELPHEHALERLCQAFLSRPDCGAMGCRLAYPDGSTQVVGGQRPRALTVLAGQAASQPASDSHGLVDTPAISGAALLTSRAVWQRVGPLDSGYFMYFEDVDWCLRARAARYRLLAAADVTVTHHEGTSYGGREFVRREHFWRAFLRFTRRHDGPLAAAALRAGLGLTAASRLLRPATLQPGERTLSEAQARLALWGA